MHAAILSKLEAKDLRAALFGCALLALGASIKIPFYPVPFTLHTLALFLIVLTQSPKHSLYSTSCYLILATLGAPVFCLHANPSWWMGKCAGYLWAFPVAAYGMARWRVKMGNFLALSLGKSFVLFCGFLWLIPFVGTSVAWKQGLLVFVPCELVKILAASALIKWRQK